MTAVVLEKVLVSTQPVIPDKNEIHTNENVLPQKTIDHNSIAEEYTDQNNTVIDLIMQTQLKTEPITTPEPSNLRCHFNKFCLVLFVFFSFLNNHVCSLINPNTHMCSFIRRILYCTKAAAI